jgi:hypothetical protein
MAVYRFRYIGLVVCLVYRKKRHYPSQIFVILVLAYCYPFGEFLQFFYGVPRWIRFHLSDFGIIFVGVFAYAGYVIPPIVKVNITKVINFSVLWLSVISFHEYVEFQVNKGPFKGDWYDIAAYILAELIILALLLNCRQTVKSGHG